MKYAVLHIKIGLYNFIVHVFQFGLSVNYNQQNVLIVIKFKYENAIYICTKKNTQFNALSQHLIRWWFDYQSTMRLFH